ncbi:MAG: DMT family transporter [candidate division WOR-3 bacterium]
MLSHLGEIAALGTAFSWSFGSIFFTFASRQIGAFMVNRLRLTIAFSFIIITHYLIFGRLSPLASSFSWFWLGLSGLIGFTIGDTLLFRAFVLLGPRLTMLVMSLVPVFGSILARIFLNETLSQAKILAILITLFGITWAIGKRNGGRPTNYRFGIISALGAAFCQALGLFASKKGLGNNLSPISGNLIRVLVGTTTLWLFPLFWRNLGKTFKKLQDRNIFLPLLGGAIFGPFLGVGLSLIAIQRTKIGIASTLMALPPVILIPLSRWIFKERISLSAIFGTIIAFLGVALIFLL